MEREIWKDVPGFEGRYQVSPKDNGTVRSIYKNKIRILSKFINQNYWRVRFHIRGKNIDYHPGIHELLALAFIPNCNGGNVVHHIDGNKLNNSLDNLTWMKRSEHIKHHKEKRVVCYDLEGNLVKIYDRILDTEKDGFKHSAVSAVALGRRHTHHNHYFEFIG